MTDDELRKRVAEIPWFQKYEIKPWSGIWTSGPQDIGHLLSRIDLPADLGGQNVLDVGANDGALTWECERRGAQNVVALDHPTWGMAGHESPPRINGFQLGYEINDSSADVVTTDLDQKDFPPSWIDGFGLVLFCGVLYHLKAPILVLERLSKIIKPGGLLIVETHVSIRETQYPSSLHYVEGELVGDPTNYTGPNVMAVMGWLRRFGLEPKQIRTTLHCNHGNHRAVFHARKPR